MFRIYLDKNLTKEVPLEIEDAEILQRIVSVLRLKIHDRLCVFNSQGIEFESEIASITKKFVSIVPLSIIKNKSSYSFKLDLYPAIFKKPRFEWMLEKCTEIGVSEFYPIQSEHTPIKESFSDQTVERFKKIIISAIEQSEQNLIPELHSEQNLEEALSKAKGKNFVAVERIEDSGAKPPPFQFEEQQVSLFVGPEGGWSVNELELFKQHGAEFISLGKNILRAETACIVGSIIILLENNWK